MRIGGKERMNVVLDYFLQTLSQMILHLQVCKVIVTASATISMAVLYSLIVNEVVVEFEIKICCFLF